MDGNRLAALPPEITRSILRFATDVPVAVDASLETSLNEDPLETRALVEQSLDLKRTISLVSKSFHALVEEFLYEIILIRRPTGIARLVAHLREKRPGYTDRGWWVRRLELDFEVSRTMMTWNAGWDTLWGLLSACAHLQVFRLAPRGSVRAQLQHRRYYYYDWCASCSAKLLRNLAVLHGRTLRRIEFGDNIVPQPDHFAQFLSLLPALESSTALSIGYVGDTIADLGPTPEEDVSPWPEGLPEDSRLLHLHTLHMELGELPRQLAAWRLPNLKHLHVVRADDIPMDKHVFEFLRAHDCTIRSLYHERQEYNPFGRLWQVLGKLPSLEHLILADAARSRWDWLLPYEQHDHIHTLTIYRRAEYSDRDDSLVAQLEDVLKVLEEGKLPNLRDIRILGDDVGRTYLRRVRLRHFDKFGIRWDIRPTGIPA